MPVMSTTKPQVNVFWFRRDLRLNDNTGLFHALKSWQAGIACFYI